MPFSVRIKASAAKELAAIDATNRRRFVAAIDALAMDPLRGQVLKGGLTGLRRIHLGDLRVVYEVRETELVVLVVCVGHRREVYRY